jgi:Ca2+-dependent lipid-binding protein
MFHLRVTVIKGEDLHTHTPSPPSPYVILGLGSEKKQTQPKHHEHNPAWEEEFVFDVNDPDIAVLDIEVHSHGVENHLIGRGEIPINTLPRGTPRREMVQLNPRGSIEVELFAEDFGQGGEGHHHHHHH